jgi:hypothetical protein
MEFQMRNKTFISSMVGIAAAVAVAGSANAGVVIDAFTDSTVEQSKSSFGSIFNSRTGSSGGTGGSSVYPEIDATTNRLKVNTGAGTFVMVDWANYDANDNNGPNIDLSQLSTITFDVTSSAASKITFGIQQLGSAGTIGGVRWSTVAIAAGSSSVTLTVGQNSGGTWSTSGTGLAALSNVNYMFMSFGKTGTGAVSFDGSIGNLQYNLVPAPGALALLGVAGVVGVRRRRA